MALGHHAGDDGASLHGNLPSRPRRRAATLPSGRVMAAPSAPRASPRDFPGCPCCQQWDPPHSYTPVVGPLCHRQRHVSAAIQCTRLMGTATADGNRRASGTSANNDGPTRSLGNVRLMEAHRVSGEPMGPWTEQTGHRRSRGSPEGAGVSPGPAVPAQGQQFAPEAAAAPYKAGGSVRGRWASAGWTGATGPSGPVGPPAGRDQYGAAAAARAPAAARPPARAVSAAHAEPGHGQPAAAAVQLRLRRLSPGRGVTAHTAGHSGRALRTECCGPLPG